MTNEEAIRIIKAMRQDWDVNSKCPNANALDLAIEALQKQIPKKPNKAIDRSWGIEKEVSVCPVCDCYLTMIHFIEIGEGKSIKTSYCETCGQKIDWSDEE